jgi:hypothetical protein
LTAHDLLDGLQIVLGNPPWHCSDFLALTLYAQLNDRYAQESSPMRNLLLRIER